VGVGVRLTCAAVLSCPLFAAAAVAGGAFSIRDAINQAVETHPGVGEAAANRRATETELRQIQSTLLPQVRLDARWGKERYNFQNSFPPPLGNNTTLTGREASVVVRQILFDGFASLNEIWRQAARVDAAAYRVHERSELIALDAAEAYIDLVRYTHLVSLADENIVAHRRILSNVRARFEGGRAGEGDLQQVIERVHAAEAARAEFRERLDEVRGTYRKVIGLEPFNFRVPERLAGLPRTKDESLAVTIQRNPTLQAAQADRDAAKHAFDVTAGAFMPTISAEGRALTGDNTDTVFGKRTDVSAYLVASWDIFRGGRDVWKRAEEAERYTEQTMRQARLQRDAFESIDKAWAARTITADRIAALIRQNVADRKVIAAYQKEYELGQRSLIDLLNAQNQLFNGLVSLESARGVAVFADYQLLAAMGQLLEYLKTAQPVDAEPLVSKPWGLIPYRLPTFLLKLPEPGPEPLNVGYNTPAPGPISPTTAVKTMGFSDRWIEPNRPTSPDLPKWFANPTGSPSPAPHGRPTSRLDGSPEWLTPYSDGSWDIAGILRAPVRTEAPMAKAEN